MKRSFFISFLMVLLLSVCGPPALAADAEKPLAQVNGELVTPAEYRRFILKLPPDSVGGGVDKEALKRLIGEKLILQEARRRGVSTTDDEVQQSISDFLRENNVSQKAFEEQITGRGISMAEYRAWLKDNIIVIAKMVRREVEDKVTVDDEDIRRYYAANRDRFASGPDRVRIKAIFLRLDEQASLPEVTALKIKALRLVSELKRGTSFDTLAALYPENALKAHDGVLGEFRKGDLVPALEKRIDAMKDGDISPPVWLKEGAYIIKLEERVRPAASLETVRREISSRLFKERRQHLYDAWVKSLWDRSTITIY